MPNSSESVRVNRQEFRVITEQASYLLRFSVRYVQRDGQEHCIRRCVGASAKSMLWLVGKPSQNVALWLKEKGATVKLIRSWNE